MLKSKIIASIAAVLLSASAFADTLSASVDRASVPVSQNVNLRLELSGGKSAETPDLSPLASDFEINGQGQSSVTKIINGNVTSSRVWQLSLRPKHTGQIEIPSLNAGQASSAPIQVNVTAESATAQSPSMRGVNFAAHSAKSEVYKGERVRIDYVLHSNRSLQNLQLPDLKVADAIVERVGEPKVVGQSVRFSYFITPMKAGALKIPPLVVQGEMEKPVARRSHVDPFAGFMGDDQGGPFAEMQNMMKRFASADDDFFQGFARLQPVTLASSPLALNVLPPVAGVVPWLPANHITLSANVTQTPFKVGEPIELRVHEEGSGISPAQLPGLEEQLAANSDFKVYPEQANDSQPRADLSVRDQVFSLIPQKAGRLQIPTLNISYFDVASRSTKTAQWMGQAISVAPAAPGLAPQRAESPPMAPAHFATALKKPDHTVEFELGFGVLALAAMGLAAFRFSKREIKFQPTPPAEVKASRKLTTLKDLNSAITTAEIQKFLQAYAHDHWGVAAHAPLGTSLNAAGAYGFDSAKLLELKKVIEADLYAGRPANLDSLRSQLRAVLSVKPRRSNSDIVGRAGMAELNPT